MQKRRHFKVLILVLCCVSLLQIASWLPGASHTPTASARAFVIGSDPIDGSTINKPPTVVHIYFDAPLAEASQASVYAYPPGGSTDGLLVNAGPSVINAATPSEMDIPLVPAKELPQGSYEVRWIALSLTDGRTTSGLIGFNLGTSATGVAGTPTLGPSTSNSFPQLDLQGALAVAWDWLVLLVLLFWIGLLLTDTLVISRSAPAAFLIQARKHSLSVQSLCLLALLVGEVINLLLRATSFTQTLARGSISLDIILQFMLHTDYGLLWLVRMGLLLLAFLLYWVGKTRQEGTQKGMSLKQDSPAPTGRAHTRFRRLRQQAEQTVSTSMPALARSQPRVTGAVNAHTPPTRNTNTLQPHITIKFHQTPMPLHEIPRWQVVSKLALAGLILLTLVLSNDLVHLVALPISVGILSWLSLAAQATWFGSLAYLGLVLLPALPVADPDHYAETLVQILKRAMPLLLLSIAVLLVSEVFLTEATIQVPTQFVTHPYGRALLVRASLLLLMVFLTGYTLLSLLPLLQRQTVLLPVVDAEMPARRTRQFKLEKTARTIKRACNALSAVAAVTVICLALMNFFTPPVVFPNVNYQALVDQANGVNGSSGSAMSSQTQQVGTLTVTLQVFPARASAANTVVLLLSDAQGKPVHNATVNLRINMLIMDMGEASATLKGSDSVYAAIFPANQAFSMAGNWVVKVDIHRPGQSLTSLTFNVQVT